MAVEDFSREGILDALRKRHVYASTDNILADVRSGTHTFGDAFATGEVPELRLKLTGTQPFTRVAVIKDNQYVYTAEPGTAEVEFRWRDNAPKAGKTSYWITYTGEGRRGVVSSDIGAFVAIHCAASLLASSLHTLVAPEHWARLSLMSRYWSGADAHAAGVWERIRRLVGAVALLA